MKENRRYLTKEEFEAIPENLEFSSRLKEAEKNTNNVDYVAGILPAVKVDDAWYVGNIGLTPEAITKDLASLAKFGYDIKLSDPLFRIKSPNENDMVMYRILNPEDVIHSSITGDGMYA